MTDSFLIAPSIIRGGRYPAISAQQLAQVLRKSKRSSFLAHWMVFNDEPGDSSSFSFIYFGHAWHYSAPEDTLLDFPGFNAVFKLGHGERSTIA